MAKRRIIAGFLSVLLSVFFNNNLPFELCPANSHTAQLSYRTKAAKSIFVSDISFGKPIAKKEHIKVRYMGSHCGYNGAPFHIVFKKRTFTEPVTDIVKSCSFISSNGRFLFKLRGPPAINATHNSAAAPEII